MANGRWKSFGFSATDYWLASCFLSRHFPATSIVNERNQGTLALLINSPLSALSIYFGKLSGVLLFSTLVLLCSLPASAACFAMGGIDLTRDLGLLYLILMLAIVQYVTLGMLVSSFVHSADAGVRITYSAVLGLFLLTLVPAALSRGAFLTGWTSTLINAIRSFSPLPSVVELMGQQSLGSVGLRQSSTTPSFVFTALLSSGIFAIITVARLNHRIFDRSRAKGLITDDRGLLTRLIRRLVYIVDPQRRKRGIPWYLNPVMVKEFRCRRFGRTQWLLRLVSVCAVLSMVLTIMAATSATAWGVETVGGLLVLLQVVLVVVLTPSLASGLISGERDGGSWELLGLTSLSRLQDRPRQAAQRGVDTGDGADGYSARLFDDDLHRTSDVVAGPNRIGLFGLDGRSTLWQSVQRQAACFDRQRFRPA